MGKENKVNVSCYGTLNVIVFLAFFIAKIFGYINWSWLWVLCPLWIPLVIFLCFLGFCIIGYLILALIDS